MLKQLKPYRKFKSKGLCPIVVNQQFFKKLQSYLLINPKKQRDFIVRKVLSVDDAVVPSNCSNFFFRKNSVWGLQAETYGVITEQSLEMVRRSIRRLVGKFVPVHVRVAAKVPIYERAAKSRMGKGKGAKFLHHVYHVCPGRILIEIRGFNGKFEADWLLKKLSFKSRWVLLNKM